MNSASALEQISHGLTEGGQGGERDIRTLPGANHSVPMPTFSDFAAWWMQERQGEWSRAYKTEIRSSLKRYLVPVFGGHRVDEITLDEAVRFRDVVAGRPGRQGRSMSPQRVNKILGLLRGILAEAASLHGFDSPMVDMEMLKRQPVARDPFTAEEMAAILAAVPAIYRDYLTVRFLTGLRCGEIKRLQWCDVDMRRNRLLVREKPPEDAELEHRLQPVSREVPMGPRVREIFERRFQTHDPSVQWLFPGRQGNPFNIVNFSNRIWTPLLLHLGLKARAVGQTRHTAAALMLGAGEDPEWVGRVLGLPVEAVVKNYARWIPRYARQPGEAFAQLVGDSSAPVPTGGQSATPEQVSPTKAQRSALALPEDQQGQSQATQPRGRKGARKKDAARTADAPIPQGVLTRWTPEEDRKILAQYQHTGPAGTAACLPGRSRRAITKRAAVLGVSYREGSAHPPGKPWSPTELQVLASHVEGQPVPELPGRTEAAVKSRLASMRNGLGASKTLRPWQPTEDAFIRAEYGRMGGAACAKVLGRTKAALYNRACEIGVAKNPGANRRK